MNSVDNFRLIVRAPPLPRLAQAEMCAFARLCRWTPTGAAQQMARVAARASRRSRPGQRRARDLTKVILRLPGGKMPLRPGVSGMERLCGAAHEEICAAEAGYREREAERERARAGERENVCMCKCVRLSARVHRTYPVRALLRALPKRDA